MATAIDLNSYSQAEEQIQGLKTKILIIEYDHNVMKSMKYFLNKSNIVGYKVTKPQVLKVLKSNVDLGAIFIPEVDNQGKSNIGLATKIHQTRPELPMFLRREHCNQLDDLPDDSQKMFSGAFIGVQYDHLKVLLETYLFTRHYPTEFVNGIKELSLNSFRAAFKNLNIVVDSPYIVKDKIIYGELFSLMPLESTWCRGYMMLQTEEWNIMEVIKAHKTSLNPMEPNFRDVNAVLGELSNMIWGSFKQYYGNNSSKEHGRLRVEVPIIVNHSRKYISFGSDDPQLCFKYTLSDPDGELKAITLYQKFIFSLDWSPEKFEENEKNVEELVENGALELF